MAVRFEFYLEDDDANKLFAIKEKKGKETMNVNEFAKELLEGEIYRLHPGPVHNSDDME